MVDFEGNADAVITESMLFLHHPNYFSILLVLDTLLDDNGVLLHMCERILVLNVQYNFSPRGQSRRVKLEGENGHLNKSQKVERKYNLVSIPTHLGSACISGGSW